jgi:hypothetical protein
VFSLLAGGPVGLTLKRVTVSLLGRSPAMKERPNAVLALACVLCVVTAVIGFGGDYINALFRSGSPAQALVTSSTQPSAEAATPAAEPDPQRDESQITVYITRTGERYHRGDCVHLRRSKYAVSLKEAKQRGYTPCKVCRPAR